MKRAEFVYLSGSVPYAQNGIFTSFNSIYILELLYPQHLNPQL